MTVRAPDDLCPNAPAWQESHDWGLKRDGLWAGEPSYVQVCRNCGVTEGDARRAAEAEREGGAAGR